MPENRKIGSMFEEISPRYDLLNRLMSLGRDQYWRREAARLADLPQNGMVLDLCCGTGDLALELAHSRSCPTVFGLDLSEEMLRRSRTKLDRDSRPLIVHLLRGDATHLPLAGGTFDAVTIAFGLRNITDRKEAIKEVIRVLRTGGRFVVLEFSHPEKRFFRYAYHLYLKSVPLFLSYLLGTDSRAYRYLARSVIAFPGATQLAGLLENCGLKKVTYHHFFLGTVAIHTGSK